MSVLAVDFDGSLATEQGQGPFPRPLVWMPGARPAVRILARHHTLILHTARLTPVDAALPGREEPAEVWRARRQQLEEALRAQRMWLRADGGVFDLLWDRPGKPAADLFIDDRSLAGRPDWSRILGQWG